MSEWKGMKNLVGDRIIYQAYRIINPNEPMHAGNVVTNGKIYDTDSEARKEADRLNEEAAAAAG